MKLAGAFVLAVVLVVLAVNLWIVAMQFAASACVVWPFCSWGAR